MKKNVRHISLEGYPTKYYIAPDQYSSKLSKIIKNKESLRNYHSQEASKET